MDKRVLMLLLIGAVGLIWYLLYQYGGMPVSRKTAICYIASRGGRRASFTACDGYTKQILRFPVSGKISFHFIPELSKGHVTAELLDSTGTELLCLNGQNSSGVVTVEKSKKYTLVIRFDVATGSYSLMWE